MPAHLLSGHDFEALPVPPNSHVLDNGGSSFYRYKRMQVTCPGGESTWNFLSNCLYLLKEIRNYAMS